MVIKTAKKTQSRYATASALQAPHQANSMNVMSEVVKRAQQIFAYPDNRHERNEIERFDKLAFLSRLSNSGNRRRTSGFYVSYCTPLWQTLASTIFGPHFCPPEATLGPQEPMRHAGRGGYRHNFVHSAITC